MIQLDTFLAYGFAASLASFPRKAKPSTSTCQPQPCGASSLDARFALTVLWLAIAFAPQAVYLMWRYPAWESMYVYLDHDPLPAWLAALVPISIVVAGAVAFVLTRWLRARGNKGVALALMIASFAVPLVLATFGWDGTGYRRLLCAAGPQAWLAGEPGSLGAFLGSDLAFTLLWLEGALLVPYALMVVLWRRPRGLARDPRAPLAAEPTPEVGS